MASDKEIFATQQNMAKSAVTFANFIDPTLFALVPPTGWLNRIDEVLCYHGAATRDGSPLGVALGNLIRSWQGTAAREDSGAPGPEFWGPRAKPVCCLRPEGHSGRHTNQVGWSEKREPVADSELRDRVVSAIASQQAMIPDEDDGFEWERIRGDADAALSMVAPVLAERDRLRDQVRLLGEALQRRAYTDKDVAARDAQLTEAGIYFDQAEANFREIRLQLAEMVDVDKETPIPDLLGKVKAELDFRFATRQQYAEERDAAHASVRRLLTEANQAATALSAIATRSRWEYPPSLKDRIELVASELDTARAERDALQTMLRPRLNGLLGALCGQGNELADEMRVAIAVLNSGMKPDIDVNDDQPASGVGSQPDSKPGSVQ